ncbi:abc transporter atp-binding [Gossypium arboreum]|uniref:Abc transporter atp-binding n=1 Tax=Gossypium arboreum TaxID=29729 RepID=A0A0B0NJB9_GOSAR|nr:abc transporter atp-binding [Gossypium arboreum]
MTRYDDPGTVQFRLGGLIHELSVPEFGAALGLYIEEFREKNELHALSRHLHFSPSKCWHTLAPSTAFYNPSCSKTSVLPPSLREAREHWRRQHPRRLLLMHQTERHWKGVLSIGPYVTRLARHFGLLNTAA